MAIPVHMIRATSYNVTCGVTMDIGDSMELRQWIASATGSLLPVAGPLKGGHLIVSLDGVDLSGFDAIYICNDMWEERNVPRKEMDTDFRLYDAVNAGSLKLTPRPDTDFPSGDVGTIFYNSDRNVFQMYTDIPNTMLDCGEEVRNRIQNKTGGALLNGDVVMVSGAQDSKTTVALADADIDAQTDAVIGVLTMDLANNEEGYSISDGVIHDLDLSAYVEGTVLYLSQTPGKLTQTKPLQPASVIQIGIVQRSHATQGELLVGIRKRWAKDVRQLSKQDTGWAPNEYLDSSYDYSTRKITITNTSATTSAYLFWQGSLVLTLAPLGTYVSTAHTATNGSWFHYYDGTNYIWSQTAWTFDMAMLGYVKYVSASPITSFGVTETHSLMDRYVHEELHATIGTYKTAGGTFSGYVLNSTTSANRQVDISSTTLKDEDLSVTNALLTGGTGAYTLGYIAPSSLFTFIDAQDHIVPSGATIPTWNNASTGALTPLTVNQYTNVWVFGIPVMKDATSQKRRYVLLAGQSASTTRATIDAESPNTLILGDLASISAEWNVFGRILLRYTATGWSLITVNLVNTTKGSVSQTSVSGLTEVSHDSTLVGTGEASTPLGVNPTLTYQTYPLALGTSWIIDHTLASPTPTVTSIDSSGQDIELEVVYDQVVSNRIHLYAGHSLSGSVFLT